MFYIMCGIIFFLLRNSLKWISWNLKKLHSTLGLKGSLKCMAMLHNSLRSKLFSRYIFIWWVFSSSLFQIKMSINITTNKEFWCVFTESSPELWKVKSEMYINRILKDKAYEKLVEKLMPFVLHTKERELKEINNNKRSGAGSVAMCLPIL